MSSTVEDTTTPVHPLSAEAAAQYSSSPGSDADFGPDEERLILAARQAAVLRLARAM